MQQTIENGKKYCCRSLPLRYGNLPSFIPLNTCAGQRERDKLEECKEVVTKK